MKFSDFLIIYFAVGAPFGFFFFLQHRNETNPFTIYLKSISLVFVWIPYAVWLLNDFAAKRFRRDAQHFGESKRNLLQKQIEQILFDSPAEISLFELREVFERYAGLTLERNLTNNAAAVADAEIFRVGLRENINLASICLQRRNRQRIERHQISAREDFLRLIEDLNRAASDNERLRDLSVEFVQTLDDEVTGELLMNIFAAFLHGVAKRREQKMESDLWMTEQYKQSPANKVSLHLPAVVTATRED